MLREYALITDEQQAFLQQYPYPWSALLPRNHTDHFPESLQTDAYAMISYRVATKCLGDAVRNALSFPLFLTSANLSGAPESTTLSQAQQQFPDIAGKDGGECVAFFSDILTWSSDGELQYIRKNY